MDLFVIAHVALRAHQIVRRQFIALNRHLRGVRSVRSIRRACSAGRRHLRHLRVIRRGEVSGEALVILTFSHATRHNLAPGIEPVAQLVEVAI